ncbi:MAG TPA: hypothetical protein VGK73_06760 [Polyangiaceae bacterium]
MRRGIGQHALLPPLDQRIGVNAQVRLGEEIEVVRDHPHELGGAADLEQALLAIEFPRRPD